MHSYHEFLKISTKRGRLIGATCLAIALIGIATFAVRAHDTKGTVAKADPPSKQDGTLAHPYADANQCPPKTDIVIWPEEWRSIPSIPSQFSVCFVGGQSNNKSIGSDLKARD